MQKQYTQRIPHPGPKNIAKKKDQNTVPAEEEKGGMKRILSPTTSAYVGRLAPTPSGLLHIGHARTFYTAYRRCLANSGVLILRIEDLGLHHSLTHSLTHLLTYLLTYLLTRLLTDNYLFTHLLISSTLII